MGQPVLFVVRSALMKNNFPGIAFCVFLGSIAWIVAEIEESIIDRAVIDALVIALVLGILAKNLLPLPATFGSVSYTHLTLPTIHLV